MLTILKMNLLQTFSFRRWCGRILPPCSDDERQRGSNSVALSQATVAAASLMGIEGLVKTLPTDTEIAGKTILPKWSRQKPGFGWKKQPKGTESNVIFVIILQRRKASYGHGLVPPGGRRQVGGSVESCETV